MVVKRKFKCGKNLEHCKDKDHVHDIDIMTAKMNKCGGRKKTQAW
jgi:hypothetical protein